MSLGKMLMRRHHEHHYHQQQARQRRRERAAGRYLGRLLAGVPTFAALHLLLRWLSRRPAAL
jgi:hypothetical protein